MGTKQQNHKKNLKKQTNKNQQQHCLQTDT